MNILLLEDRWGTTFYINELMKGEGHNVLEAVNLKDAQDYWDNRNRVPIHCIILDLNMVTVGLTELQKEKSLGGLLSGWIWLYENVLTFEPQMRQRTIIYSDYISTLKANVNEKITKGIIILSKRQHKELIPYIREISRMTKL
jgi:CheY-like chemotaxis protein